MKRIKEKYARIVKYWRISYRQASKEERLLLGLSLLIMLTYLWWGMLAL